MNKQDEREDFVSDPTATRDIGGTYGGAAGTMPDSTTEPTVETANARRLERTGADDAQQAVVSALPDTSSDPSAGISVPTGAAPAYRASGDQGTGDHPMSHTTADDVDISQTDHREAAQDPDRGLGRNWTADSPPDQEFLENPPTRKTGGGQDVAANDAF